MNVLLLGAGSSKAYSQSPTGLTMPIACDFFNTFEKLDIYKNPWVLQEGLHDYLMRIKCVDPYSYLKSGINIEELHTEIEEHFHDTFNNSESPERMSAFRSYNELSYIFSSVINEIQNGPVSLPHISLIEHLNPDDVIITFNWDTLMDQALATTTEWTIDTGYGFKPKSIYRNNWVPPIESSSNFIKLLKLHGSSNWLTSHPSIIDNKVTLVQQAEPDTVWLYEYASEPYNCYDGRYMPDYEAFSYGYYPPNLPDIGKPAPDDHILIRTKPRVPWKPKGTAGSEGLDSAPLIIPPVRDKKYDFYGALFNYLWDEAGNAIEEAEHIIIIGYSFPRTDIRSTNLFISSLMKRNTMPHISILSPHPESVADKFKIEFGIQDSHLHTYPDYFSEDFVLDSLFNI